MDQISKEINIIKELPSHNNIVKFIDSIIGNPLAGKFEL